MTTILARLKAIGAAAVLAATIAVTGLAAAPALAQGQPPSNFSLSVPGGDSNTMTMQAPGNQRATESRRYDRRYYCLTDRQIIRGLRDYGFERARIVRNLRGERVEAIANWGRYQYSMRIDRCTGVVDRIRLIRRGGVGLQFNFAN